MLSDFLDDPWHGRGEGIGAGLGQGERCSVVVGFDSLAKNAARVVLMVDGKVLLEAAERTDFVHEVDITAEVPGLSVFQMLYDWACRMHTI